MLTVTLKLQIERPNDVNTVMFAALADIQKFETNMDGAMTCLQDRFGKNHSLYWVYRGGSHIAIHSRNHKQRIAIISG